MPTSTLFDQNLNEKMFLLVAPKPLKSEYVDQASRLIDSKCIYLSIKAIIGTFSDMCIY